MCRFSVNFGFITSRLTTYSHSFTLGDTRAGPPIFGVGKVVFVIHLSTSFVKTLFFMECFFILIQQNFNRCARH